MKKINLKQNQKKTMITIAGAGLLLTGLLVASPFYLPDDTPIKDTWRTSIYTSMGLSVKVSDVTTSKESGESFFTLVHDGKSFNNETIKLSLHAINQDGTLSPVQNVSQLTLESEEKNNLKITGYSFFWPQNTYHLQVTITSLDSDNHLVNQQIIYLDQRKVNVVEESFTMTDYVENRLTDYLVPTMQTSTNKVENPVATKEENKNSDEITGDDIQTPNEEIQNSTGTLQQTYVIEGAELVQSDYDGHNHDDNENVEPQYTLEDLEHQLSKAEESLKSNPNDETLQEQISNLKKEIENKKASE